MREVEWTEGKTATNLDDNDGLLHHVVDLGLDKVQQRADTALCGLLHLDGTATNGTHRLAHKVHIHFRCIPEQQTQKI